MTPEDHHLYGAVCAGFAAQLGMQELEVYLKGSITFRFRRLVMAWCVFFGVLCLTGCAFHATLNPPEVEFVYAYGRITDCPGGVPPQLTPQMSRMEPEDMTPAPEPLCHTVEVGAMNWSNMVSAIGTALISIIPLL